MDLALNNQQRLICHKTNRPNNQQSRDVLIKIIEILDEMLLKFGKIWYEEYLLSLRENCLGLHETNY